MIRPLAAQFLNNETAMQFARFFVVGTLGFLTDGGLSQLLVTSGGLSPFIARIPAFLVAVLVTWWLNRKYTFKVGASHPYLKSFLAYLSGNLIGISINLGIYYTAIALMPSLGAWPIIPVAAGSIAAMLVNFSLAKWWVFKKKV